MVFPIFPMVMSNKAKEVGNGGLWKTSKFEISNGHNWGAIWSYRAVSTTVGTARTWSCSGEGSQGAWGLGLWEQVENVTFLRFVFGKSWNNILRAFLEPQGPQDPACVRERRILFQIALTRALYDQMAPQLCQFLRSSKTQKFLKFLLLRF